MKTALASRSRSAATGAAAATLAFISACTVGPDYREPRIDAPGEWSRGTAADGPASTVELRRWWTTLNDPALDSLVQRALEGNIDLRIAAARVFQARALRDGAESGGLPTVNAGATYERQRNSSDLVTVPLGARNRAVNFYSAGFDASWELDVWGAVRRSVEASDAALTAAEEFRRDVIVTLLAEVARNYIDLRTFQNRLAIAQQNIKAQADTLSLTEARLNAGLTSELDVTRARTNLETTRSQVPLLDAGVRFAAHRLAVLTGQNPGALLDELLPAQPNAPIPAASAVIPPGLPSDLVRRRPDLRAAERQLAAANAQIGIAVAELYPRFSLNGAIALQAGDAGALFNSTNVAYAAGPAVTWRLIDFGSIRSNISFQEYRTLEALETYRAVALAAFEETENALVAFAREQVRRESLRLAVAASQRSVELAESLYSRGLTDFQNVLDAQRSLYELQDQLSLSDGAVTTNLVAVYKALGGGWEEAMPRMEPGRTTPLSPWAMPSPVSQQGPIPEHAR